MNKKDLKHFEKRLHAEMETVARSIGKLEKSILQRSQRDASGDLSAYSIHMADMGDMGTDAAEREKDLILASNEGRVVVKIREALRKIREGGYGVCEECHKPISPKRLEFIPYAPLCAKCQMRAERSVS